jgi:hypothetical protein
MFPPGYPSTGVQIYVPSTGHVYGCIAIRSASGLIAYSLAAAPSAADLATSLSIIVSTTPYRGANGGATTFGEYSAGGGFGTATGGTFVVPGLPAISLQSSGNFPYQTSGTAVAGSSGSTDTNYCPSTTSGGRAGGGFMSAAYGVGAPGSNGSDGGPGSGGAAGLPTDSATPTPAGGKGGDGLLVILY